MALLFKCGQWIKTLFTTLLRFDLRKEIIELQEKVMKTQTELSLANKRITELESISALNNNSIVVANAILEIDRTTGERGAPYCNYCWQAANKRSPLSCLERHEQSDGNYLLYQCLNCNQYFRLLFKADGDISQYYPTVEVEETK